LVIGIGIRKFGHFTTVYKHSMFKLVCV
jgi:hypothetical protein